MSGTVKILSAVLLLSCVIASLGGCGCGFDCNNGNNNDQPTLLSLGLSDSVPEELKQVVIEVDSITFVRNGADDVVVDRFTIEQQDLVDVDSFQVDLLEYRGVNQLVVIDNLELDRATYREVLISVLDGDINRSYAQEADDSLKQINVPAAGLSLPGIVVTGDEQQFTVEFGLAQSLQLQTADDSYLLATDGIRLEDNALAATLSGRLDTTLFDSEAPCDEKEDPEVGNRVYIYEGTDLGDRQLADVFTDGSSTEIPAEALPPFAVATLIENSLNGTWEYSFGFLPAGDYTMAFACDTQEDDPEDFDDLVVPQPASQVYELTLDEGEQVVCDLDEVADCL